MNLLVFLLAVSVITGLYREFGNQPGALVFFSIVAWSSLQHIVRKRQP